MINLARLSPSQEARKQRSILALYSGRAVSSQEIPSSLGGLLINFGECPPSAGVASPSQLSIELDRNVTSILASRERVTNPGAVPIRPEKRSPLPGQRPAGHHRGHGRKRPAGAGRLA